MTATATATRRHACLGQRHTLRAPDPPMGSRKIALLGAAPASLGLSAPGHAGAPFSSPVPCPRRGAPGLPGPARRDPRGGASVAAPRARPGQSRGPSAGRTGEEGQTT